MKARRIGTTAEFEIEGIIMNGIGYVMEEVEVLPTVTELSTTSPDWNQIKIQAAIAAMQGMIANPNIKRPAGEANLEAELIQFSSIAIEYADSLITELKKQNP